MKRWIVHGLLNVIAFVVGIISPRVHLVSAWLLAIIAFDLLRIRRRVVLKNLEIAFGRNKSERERVSIARESYCQFMRTIFETLGSWRYFNQVQLTIVGGENLQNALAQGRGVYVICGHMGNWELLSAMTSRRFAPAAAITKPVGGPIVASWVMGMRAKYPVTEVNRMVSRVPHREIFKALDKGMVIGTIIDQRHSRGEWIPLFGTPALTNVSLLRMWEHRPAPLIPGMIRRTGLWSHEIEMMPELVLETNPSWTADQFITQNAIQFNRVMEQIINKCPSQYFWLHNRWKGSDSLADSLKT